MLVGAVDCRVNRYCPVHFTLGIGHRQVIITQDSQIGVFAGCKGSNLMVVEGEPRSALRIQTKRFEARDLLVGIADDPGALDVIDTTEGIQ